MQHIVSNYHLYPLSPSSDRWKSTEWIETDGCGGWSSQATGSLCTRRYHSILLANETDGRYNYISQLEESAIVNGTTYPLSSNIFPGVIHPEGYTNIEKVGIGPGFLTVYRIGSATLIRELIKEKGTPSTLLRYSWSGETPLQLHISPLFSYRGFHSLQRANTTIVHAVDKEGEGISFNPIPAMPKTYAYHTPCEISDHFDWFYRFQYAGEKERGLDFEEDLFSLVKLSFSIPPQKDVVVGFSRVPMFGDLRERFHLVLAKNNKRIRSFSHRKGSPQWHLARSASQCIIKTPRGNPGIVAGYHWFEEWGRDTFLSLPYFLDYFENKEEIYQIFLDFLHARKEGVIPNRFFNAKLDALDPNAPFAEYNSVDALLWLGVAAFKVFEHFQDLSFIKEIHPLLKECAEHFKKGTLYGIQEIDGLLYAGNKDTQLSWMDAKVNGFPVTPRSGAAVEINAGWYNLKKILAYFSQLLSLDEDFKYFSLSAEQNLKAFRSTFMIRGKGYLADVWDGYREADCLLQT
jgi:predicted glycogen debranching enzyme